MTPEHVIVCIGGEPPYPDPDAIPGADLVIGADSGVDVALQLGLRVDLAIGDLDSISDAALGTLRSWGAVVEACSPDKDASDLELGLRRALTLGARVITVVGGAGGRLDHELGNLLVLSSRQFASAKVRAQLGSNSIAVLHGPSELEVVGRPGDLLSVFALDGPAEGIDIVGTLYEVRDGVLAHGSSLGLSNELRSLDRANAAGAARAKVAVRQGCAIVISAGSQGQLTGAGVPPRRVATAG